MGRSKYRTGWSVTVDGKEYFEAYYRQDERSYAVPLWGQRAACDIPERHVGGISGTEFCTRCEDRFCAIATDPPRLDAWHTYVQRQLERSARDRAWEREYGSLDSEGDTPCRILA